MPQNEALPPIKRKRGRPPKIHQWITAFQHIVNQEMNAVYYTDDELRQLTNHQVEEKHQISSRTFKYWKAGSLQDPVLNRFKELYAQALLSQKYHLFKKLAEDDKWQRWSWIIERKFDEWNLKNKQETIHKIEQPLFPNEVENKKN